MVRATVALAALAMSAALVGCGVGFNTATEQVRPAHPSGEVGPIKVRSLMLIQSEGGGPAAAVVTLVNAGDAPDTLSNLQIAPPQPPGNTAAPTASPLDVPASVTVPSRGAVHVGAQSQPTVTVDGLERLAAPGQLVRVTLTFENAGRLTLDVVVAGGTGPFASFVPAPTASPSG